MPLGFRDANGLVRQAQLNMTRSYVQLRDVELKTIEYLSFSYRRVIETHSRIAPARGERESLQRYIWRVREVIRGGGWKPEEFLNYLTVQQQLAAAIATEQRAVADYNTALAAFEFAKGTVQQYNKVSIGEGPLPPWGVEASGRPHPRADGSGHQVARATAVAGGRGGGRPTGRPGRWHAVHPGFAAVRREAGTVADDTAAAAAGRSDEAEHRPRAASTSGREHWRDGTGTGRLLQAGRARHDSAPAAEPTRFH